ncbi:MAG: sensor domain-containing diguanylate cyclase [Spirochaetes bacterium]|jgi:diguanylate cyclase (GGDEF)-like protein|nr:sensor domain-containing diguanylate cyclase [Spirochaetota bacterium]
MENLKRKIEELKHENNNLKEYSIKLSTLIDVSSLVVSSLNKETVLKTILDQTKTLMSCREASVLLVDNESDQLYFAILSDHEDAQALESVRLNRGEGVAGKVWEKGTSVITGGQNNDESISKKVDTTLANTTRSLIAIPLSVKGEIIGVMEAINKDGAETFNEDDREIFGILANQAAIAIYNAELYEMATRDGMTKLYIRRYFDTRLKEEFARSIRYDRDLSLIMFDIDHFKNFNDTYGHQLGDEVLKKTASIIMDCCRACDIPARFGGEEFSVILPETGVDGAMNVAERVRRTVEETKIDHDESQITLTISAGVGVLSRAHCKKDHELILCTDKALYTSKENGRNCVSLCPSS